jgi:hypothetical protein
MIGGGGTCLVFSHALAFALQFETAAHSNKTSSIQSLLQENTTRNYYKALLINDVLENGRLR